MTILLEIIYLWTRVWTVNIDFLSIYKRVHALIRRILFWFLFQTHVSFFLFLTHCELKNKHSGTTVRYIYDLEINSTWSKLKCVSTSGREIHSKKSSRPEIYYRVYIENLVRLSFNETWFECVLQVLFLFHMCHWKSVQSNFV